MTIGELYDKWGKEGNPALYAKTKGAFRIAFSVLPKETDCNDLTLQMIRDAMRKSTSVREYMAKASSVMVHVLEFGHAVDPGWCKKPNFTYSDILREPVVKKVKKKRKEKEKLA